MSYTAKHIGDGKFEAIFHDTSEVFECSSSFVEMIISIYFKDNTNPPIGWEITQEQLYKDWNEGKFMT